jgi:hypothetical protein
VSHSVVSNFWIVSERSSIQLIRPAELLCPEEAISPADSSVLPRSLKTGFWLAQVIAQGGRRSPAKPLGCSPICEGYPLMKTILGSLLLLVAVAVTSGCSATHGPGAHRWGCGVFSKCGHGCADGGCAQPGCTSDGCTSAGCADGACANGACAEGHAGHAHGGHFAGHCGGCGAGLLHGCKNCGHCGLPCGHGLLGHHKQYTDIGAQNQGLSNGPPTGTVAYPYYTTRGPRDFFAANPPSIGP